MRNYFYDPDAMNIPWTESPFFLKLLDNKGHSDLERETLINFHNKGYIILDLDLDNQIIDNLKNDIDKLIYSSKLKTNSSFFSYNESPRIVDAGKSNHRVVELALNQKVLTILRLLYRKEPIPFSTINFIRGTEQPLHSDTIHFGSIPKGYLSACWIALEDTNKDNGALRVVEGSHKLKDIDYFDLNIKPAKNMKLVEGIYREYEQYVRKLVDVMGMREKIVSMKKGSALIWSANLLHGGSKILDKHSTRYSQVTHYNFEGCDFYYHPFFSAPLKGKYIKRDLKGLDIRNLK